nr:polycystic kidney disease protein 1-like 3 [Ipomoea batatas]
MDSTTTSPCARDDNPLPAKLRFMCFYGGHIIPRPHHKSLSYVGGEKRIVAVDRGVSLAELRRHLSHTLLNGLQRFTLKYQLPHEELDSLVSIANDEDLENMVQEYDRMIASPVRLPRLRFFLFPDRPETAASAGCLLADAKSEQWFVDAINDSGLVSRAFSDPAIDINAVDLDGISISKVDSCLNVSNQDVQSTPDSVARYLVNICCSESNSASSWKQIMYQDATPPVTNWETISRPSAIMDLSSSQVLMHHPPVQQPPQLLHYIHHPTPDPVPLPVSYYPIYAPPQQQLDQQPPLYVLPVAAQAPAPYNFPANIPDAAAPPPPNAAQQYLGISQVQHIAAPGSQVYYAAAQCPAAVAPLPSQYQTVTPATAVLISQATAAQLPGENSMQQILTSQPL